MDLRSAARMSGSRGVFLLLASLLWTAAAGGDPIDSASEQSIKAAYLYKFADYVEWPESAMRDRRAPLTIGVIGADSLADELEEMTRGRTAHGRPIEVKRITAEDPLRGLHVLFVSAAGSADLRDLTMAARQHSVLLVTESGDALEVGSIINFRPVDQRIRFEVSLDSADRSHLKLSARLLAVALHVEQRTH
jgi:YfiR/HmsC-like